MTDRWPIPSDETVRELVTRIVDATRNVAADRRPAAPPPSAAPFPVVPGDGAGDGAGDDAGDDAGDGAATRLSIALGADHGGYLLKERIGATLADQGYVIRDCGTNSADPVDYPDIAYAVSRLVADGECRWGIIVDGAGIGSCMVANKVPGVRAALCHDLSSARNSREHNHANVLTLGARFIGEGLALEIVGAWLATPWGPGRHAARVDKITEIERRSMAQGVGSRAG
jgi:ribose 5-phosphate isomerase B